MAFTITNDGTSRLLNTAGGTAGSYYFLNEIAPGTKLDPGTTYAGGEITSFGSSFANVSLANVELQKFQTGATIANILPAATGAFISAAGSWRNSTAGVEYYVARIINNAFTIVSHFNTSEAEVVADRHSSVVGRVPTLGNPYNIQNQTLPANSQYFQVNDFIITLFQGNRPGLFHVTGANAITSTAVDGVDYVHASIDAAYTSPDVIFTGDSNGTGVNFNATYFGKAGSEIKITSGVELKLDSTRGTYIGKDFNYTRQNTTNSATSDAHINIESGGTLTITGDIDTKPTGMILLSDNISQGSSDSGTNTIQVEGGTLDISNTTLVLGARIRTHGGTIKIRDCNIEFRLKSPTNKASNIFISGTAANIIDIDGLSISGGGDGFWPDAPNITYTNIKRVSVVEADVAWPIGANTQQLYTIEDLITPLPTEANANTIDVPFWSNGIAQSTYFETYRTIIVNRSKNGSDVNVGELQASTAANVFASNKGMVHIHNEFDVLCTNVDGTPLQDDIIYIRDVDDDARPNKDGDLTYGLWGNTLNVDKTYGGNFAAGKTTSTGKLPFAFKILLAVAYRATGESRTTRRPVAASPADKANISPTDNTMSYRGANGDNSDEFDVALYKYSKVFDFERVIMKDLTATTGTGVRPVVLERIRADDPDIVETDEAVVDAYTEVNNLDQIYDRLKLLKKSNLDLPTKGSLFAERTGDEITLVSGWNLVLGTAVATKDPIVDEASKTITMKAGPVISQGTVYKSLRVTGNLSITGTYFSTTNQNSTDVINCTGTITQADTFERIRYTFTQANAAGVIEMEYIGTDGIYRTIPVSGVSSTTTDGTATDFASKFIHPNVLSPATGLVGGVNLPAFGYKVTKTGSTVTFEDTFARHRGHPRGGLIPVFLESAGGATSATFTTDNYVRGGVNTIGSDSMLMADNTRIWSRFNDVVKDSQLYKGNTAAAVLSFGYTGPNVVPLAKAPTTAHFYVTHRTRKKLSILNQTVATPQVISATSPLFDFPALTTLQVATNAQSLLTAGSLVVGNADIAMNLDVTADDLVAAIHIHDTTHPSETSALAALNFANKSVRLDRRVDIGNGLTISEGTSVTSVDFSGTGIQFFRGNGNSRVEVGSLSDAVAYKKVNLTGDSVPAVVNVFVKKTDGTVPANSGVTNGNYQEFLRAGFDDTGVQVKLAAWGYNTRVVTTNLNDSLPINSSLTANTNVSTAVPGAAKRAGVNISTVTGTPSEKVEVTATAGVVNVQDLIDVIEYHKVETPGTFDWVGSIKYTSGSNTADSFIIDGLVVELKKNLDAQDRYVELENSGVTQSTFTGGVADFVWTNQREEGVFYISTTILDDQGNDISAETAVLFYTDPATTRNSYNAASGLIGGRVTANKITELYKPETAANLNTARWPSGLGRVTTATVVAVVQTRGGNLFLQEVTLLHRIKENPFVVNLIVDTDEISS